MALQNSEKLQIIKDAICCRIMQVETLSEMTTLIIGITKQQMIAFIKNKLADGKVNHESNVINAIAAASDYQDLSDEFDALK